MTLEALLSQVMGTKGKPRKKQKTTMGKRIRKRTSQMMIQYSIVHGPVKDKCKEMREKGPDNREWVWHDHELCEWELEPASEDAWKLCKKFNSMTITQEILDYLLESHPKSWFYRWWMYEDVEDGVAEDLPTIKQLTAVYGPLSPGELHRIENYRTESGVLNPIWDGDVIMST